MSLKLWMPCINDIHNQGISNCTPINNYSIVSGGKLNGQCVKTNSNGCINTNLSYDNFNYLKNSISMCGWFKFNKAELDTIVNAQTYDSINTSFMNTLIGNSNYGGIGLTLQTNNIYNDGSFTSIKVIVSVRHTGTTNLVACSKDNISFDTWIHIAMVYIIGVGLKLYIDGELFQEANWSTITSDISCLKNTNFCINNTGIYRGNAKSSFIPFYCQDIRCYNEALSPLEVKEIAQGLCLHYKLEGLINFNNIERDVSGFNNDAIKNDITYNTNSPRYTQCSVFNGTSSIVYNNSFNYTGYIHTVSIWFKILTVPSSLVYLFALNSSGDFSDCQLGIALNINQVIGITGGSGQTLTANVTFNVNDTHNIVMVRNETTAQLYLDGVLISTKNTTDSSIGKNHLCIGGLCSNINGSNSGVSNLANVELSDFRLYATPFSSDEISRLYNKPIRIDNYGKLHCLEVVDV